MDGFSSIIQTEKVIRFLCFLNIPGKQPFNLTNMESGVLPDFMGSPFLSDKINLNQEP